MSSKSEYHPQISRAWSPGQILLYAVVGLVIAAFVSWIFFYHPAQTNFGHQ